MVTIRIRLGTVFIQGRRRPERLTYVSDDSTHPNEVVVSNNFVCSLPDQAQALYLGSKSVQYGIGVYDVTYHFVLWNAVPVWISSDDVELERLT